MAVELKELTKRSENYSQWYNDLVSSFNSTAIAISLFLFFLFKSLQN